MFNRMKTFVKNHWKKVVIGGVGVQVVLYGANYAANKFLEYHKGRADELFHKMKKDQHFESMEHTYSSTYISLLSNLKASIIQNMDSTSITELLKGGSGGPPANKLELWEELKILSFSRVLVTIYGTSLLNVILRIQLSVIGGYLFIESTQQVKEHEWRNVNGVILSNNTAIDQDLQRKYLALANYLVQEGMQKLCAYIYSKTKEVIGSLSLKQRITISDLEQIFLNIVSKIHRDTLSSEGDAPSAQGGLPSPVKCPWKYIFPPDVLEAHDYFRNSGQKCDPHYIPPDMYERLLCDTFDLLDSDDVIGILSCFESQGISHFCDRVGDCLASTQIQPTPPAPTLHNGNGSTPTGLESINNSHNHNHHHIFSEVPVPVAKLIPILNNLVESGLLGGDPWVSLLTNSEGIRVLAANVYESFSTSVE